MDFQGSILRKKEETKRIQRRIGTFKGNKYPQDDNTDLTGSKLIDYADGILSSFNIDWYVAPENTLDESVNHSQTGKVDNQENESTCGYHDEEQGPELKQHLAEPADTFANHGLADLHITDDVENIQPFQTEDLVQIKTLEWA